MVPSMAVESSPAALNTASVRIATMHPLVRDLYKRVIYVGKDYPTGLDAVRQTWKAALRNPDNCPSCYGKTAHTAACEREIRRAVGRGRAMVGEMVGVIQLKKYRAMKQRYGDEDRPSVQEAMAKLEHEATKSTS